MHTYDGVVGAVWYSGAVHPCVGRDTGWWAAAWIHLPVYHTYPVYPTHSGCIWLGMIPAYYRRWYVSVYREVHASITTGILLPESDALICLCWEG